MAVAVYLVSASDVEIHLGDLVGVIHVDSAVLGSDRYASCTGLAALGLLEPGTYHSACVCHPADGAL